MSVSVDAEEMGQRRADEEARGGRTVVAFVVDELDEEQGGGREVEFGEGEVAHGRVGDLVFSFGRGLVW